MNGSYNSSILHSLKYFNQFLIKFLILLRHFSLGDAGRCVSCFPKINL